jgi:hypothetical protein
MSNVLSMKEGRFLTPVIESIVMKGDLIKLQPDTESGVLQLQM